MTFGTFWCKLAPSFFWLLDRFSKLISLLSGESLNIKNDPNETDQIMGRPCSNTAMTPQGPQGKSLYTG